ncbi:MAG: hypothetical protein HQL54_00110 [Magnetococcales bacterium]|nr:hypothetical protein [Magnetococcales bacterium]
MASIVSAQTVVAGEPGNPPPFMASMPSQKPAPQPILPQIPAQHTMQQQYTLPETQQQQYYTQTPQQQPMSPPIATQHPMALAQQQAQHSTQEQAMPTYETLETTWVPGSTYIYYPGYWHAQSGYYRTTTYLPGPVYTTQAYIQAAYPVRQADGSYRYEYTPGQEQYWLTPPGQWGIIW